MSFYSHLLRISFLFSRLQIYGLALTLLTRGNTNGRRFKLGGRVVSDNGALERSESVSLVHHEETNGMIQPLKNAALLFF